MTDIRCEVVPIGYRSSTGQSLQRRGHSGKAVKRTYSALPALFRKRRIFVKMPRIARWSYKEDRRFMELARSAKSLEKLAKATGRSPDRIKKTAVRLGVSIKSLARKK